MDDVAIAEKRFVKNEKKKESSPTRKQSNKYKSKIHRILDTTRLGYFTKHFKDDVYRKKRNRICNTIMRQVGCLGFDLIIKLLTYDPDRRYSAIQALNHSFFSVSTPKEAGVVIELQRTVKKGKTIRKRKTSPIVYRKLHSIKKDTNPIRSDDCDFSGHPNTNDEEKRASLKKNHIHNFQNILKIVNCFQCSKT